MDIFTAALLMLLTLNIGVALGFWLCTGLRDLDSDPKYVSTLPPRGELLPNS